MNPLDRDSLLMILSTPKNALLKQYHRLFEIDGIEMEINEEAKAYIVDKALEFKLGARGLRTLCEAVFTEAMFEMPSNGEKHLKVDKAYVQAQLDTHSAALNSLKAAS